MLLSVRAGVRAALLASAAMLPLAAQAQTATTDAATPAAQDDAADEGQIVVTGQTTPNRPLITASADITLANR
jgi:iron complex outermembrane receptor protein